MPQGSLRSEKLRKQQFADNIKQGIRQKDSDYRFGINTKNMSLLKARGQKRKDMLAAVAEGKKKRIPQQAVEGFNFLKKKP